MRGNDDWATLGEVACEPVEQSGPKGTGEFLYVDIGSIDREQKAITTAQPLAGRDAPSRAKQRLRPGDVLVSMTRPNLNAVAIVPPTFDGAIGSTGFHVLRSQWMAPKYLYFIVQSQQFVDAMCSLVQGALYPAVRPGDVGEFAIRVPPRAEQTRIVDKLEELLSDLDAGAAELKAAQKKLAQYRQSLLKAAVEGRLTEPWRAQHGEPEESGAQLLARILRERRAHWEAKQLAKFEAQGKVPPKGWQAKYPEPSPPRVTGQPVLPQAWVWASLSQLLCDLRSGSAETSGRQVTDFPILKSSAVRQGVVDFRALNYLHQVQSQREENYLGIGDVLITRLSGSVEYVGCCAVVKELPSVRVQFPDRIFQGRLPLSHLWLADYVAFCFRSGYVRIILERAAKSTAGHKRISLTDLYSLPIPIPPALEVREILVLLPEGIDCTDQVEEEIDKSLRQSAAQRKNILQAAFSGRLVPQDPNDEPASVLLARIRAERGVSGATEVRRRRAAAASS